MTARALLVPDCGSGVGLGHLERMLALADELSPALATALVVPLADEELRRRVGARGHPPLEAPGSAAERAVAAALEACSDVIVLDGYGFDVASQSRLRKLARLVVVDDLGLDTDCDLAVNPSPGGERRRAPGCDAFLGGARYALLSSDYLQARAGTLSRAGAQSAVLVSTGAMDLHGITTRVVAELLRSDPGFDVAVVVGPEMAATQLADPRVEVLVSPSSLAGPLSLATVYVGAGGTTALQAACVGIPAVLTAAVANQVAQVTALAAAGCAVAAAPEDLVPACLRLLDEPELRHRMARIGRKLVDGHGAARVAGAVRALLRTAVP